MGWDPAGIVGAVKSQFVDLMPKQVNGRDVTTQIADRIAAMTD